MRVSSSSVIALAVCLSACAPEPLDFDPEGFNVRVEEIAHWGCADCEGPEQLTSLRGLAVDEDGSVFVLNKYEPFVRVWTRDGRHSLSFGADGQGPGEMTDPWHLSVRDRMISVVDTGLRRWTLYDYAGVAMATRLLEGKVSFAHFSFSGGMLFHAEPPGSQCGPPRMRNVPANESEAASVIATIDDAPLSLLTNCPVYVGSMAASPRGGFAVGYGRTEYMILIYESDGTLARKIVRDIEREPKTEADFENDREINARFAARSMKPMPHDPDRFHFYGHSLRYDSEGRLWVRTARGGDTDVVFDVFDPAGDILGSFGLPATKVGQRSPTFDVAGDYLVTSYLDEEDVPYLVLWRIAWK